MEKKRLRAGTVLLTVLMFWGVLYPQYALTEDMYEVRGSEGEVLPRECPEDFFRILSAEHDGVEIRFAVWERLREWLLEREAYGSSREAEKPGASHRGL